MIHEIQFAKPIKSQEAKRFKGEPGEVFDTRWIMVEVDIHVERKMFLNDESTIDPISS